MPHWKRIKKKHKPLEDKTCPVCGERILAKIPHECDPAICKTCYGKGELWIGRKNRAWIGYERCPRCEGTGKTIWAD